MTRRTLIMLALNAALFIVSIGLFAAATPRAASAAPRSSSGCWATITFDNPTPGTSQLNDGKIVGCSGAADQITPIQSGHLVIAHYSN